MCLFLPLPHRPSPSPANGSASPNRPAKRLRAAGFRDRRYSLSFRRPDLLATQVSPTAAPKRPQGSRDFCTEPITQRYRCVIGSGRRWRIGYRPTLATVRRSNPCIQVSCTRLSRRPRCQRGNQPNQVNKPVLPIEHSSRQPLPASVTPMLLAVRPKTTTDPTIKPVEES